MPCSKCLAKISQTTVSLARQIKNNQVEGPRHVLKKQDQSHACGYSTAFNLAKVGVRVSEAIPQLHVLWEKKLFFCVLPESVKLMRAPAALMPG